MKVRPQFRCPHSHSSTDGVPLEAWLDVVGSLVVALPCSAELPLGTEDFFTFAGVDDGRPEPKARFVKANIVCAASPKNSNSRVSLLWDPPHSVVPAFSTSTSLYAGCTLPMPYYPNPPNSNHQYIRPPRHQSPMTQARSS